MTLKNKAWLLIPCFLLLLQIDIVVNFASTEFSHFHAFGYKTVDFGCEDEVDTSAFDMGVAERGSFSEEDAAWIEQTCGIPFPRESMNVELLRFLQRTEHLHPFEDPTRFYAAPYSDEGMEEATATFAYVTSFDSWLVGYGHHCNLLCRDADAANAAITTIKSLPVTLYVLFVYMPAAILHGLTGWPPGDFDL